MIVKKYFQKNYGSVPCHNEADGIGDVLRSFPTEELRDRGYALQIIVIDNNSTDRTAAIAKRLGAKVIREPKKGKGNAIRRGFGAIAKDTDFVVMLDGDNTYRPEEILRMIEPLESRFCTVVVGSRLGGRIHHGSMAAVNRLGNWVFSSLVRHFYKVNVTDVLSGYFAWKRQAVERLRPHLMSNGFAIEMEMITKLAILGEKFIRSISYHARAGESSLRPWYDGSRIMAMLLRNLRWRPGRVKRSKKIKRVAFVSDAVFPWHKGGKETRLYEISKRLVSDTCEVHIYTMKWWREAGHSIRRYLFPCPLQVVPVVSRGRRSIRQAILFGLATSKLLFARFDVLDVDHMPFFPLFSARLVTWLRGKKLYATWHEVWGKEYWQEYLSGVPAWFGQVVERLSLMVPDVIISNSDHTTACLRRAG